jgi:hypothetical protein
LNGSEKENMDKKPLIVVSLCAVVLLVLGSLSNVGGMNTAKTTGSDTSRVDDFEEIITHIGGSACSAVVHKKGIIRDIEIWAGDEGTLMSIGGWKNNPVERFSEYNILYVHAYHFIGITIGTGYGPVKGIAFGNVEWKQYT